MSTSDRLHKIALDICNFSGFRTYCEVATGWKIRLPLNYFDSSDLQLEVEYQALKFRINSLL